MKTMSQFKTNKKSLRATSPVRPDRLGLIAAVLAIAVSCGSSSFAAKTNAPAQTSAPEESEAAYTKTIEKRVADILAVLELTEPAKAAKAHDLLVTQYRTLRDWHDANDARRKVAKGAEAEQLKASLKAIHDKFIAALSAELTPEQVEKVKDKMTYGKVQFTYAGYLAVYPNLAEQHKEKILGLLKEAREEAMDGGSSDEKSAIFNRFKGKINNYLSAQGIHASKKNKPAAPATNSPAQNEK
jgi:Protein of unknown function (DUF3826)